MDQELKDALQQMLGSRAVWLLTQLALGVGLMYIIDKFFKMVEEKLSDDTKFEIAVWLVGVEAGKKLEPWPETFAKVFDRVFGEKHLSWTCFGRSCLATLITLPLTAVLVVLLTHGVMHNLWELKAFLIGAVTNNLVFDYLSLLKTRYFMRTMGGGVTALRMVLIVFVDAALGVAIAYGAILAAAVSWTKWISLESTDMIVELVPLLIFLLMFVAAMFTSIWLWLYAGSGFLLKAARRFDVGFQWFNRRFDIEKKPLSAIGLVAGALVAVLYWGFAVGSWIVKK
jgi:hypothetical protein